MLHACANTRGAGKDSCTQHGAPRRELKERERKRAAAMSQSLQKFLLPKKKTAVNTEGDAAPSGSQIG